MSMGMNFNPDCFELQYHIWFCSPSTGCPEGTYDLNCQRMHKYLNGGSCDTVIGTYHCPPGFIGADCSQTCPEDHHGRDCVQPCSCGSGQCDPVTGRCQCPPGKMRARCQQGYLQFPKHTKHVVISVIKVYSVNENMDE
ncbi:multiple epidermal growth factor-like domains protein 6 isoform X2 [Prionailurus bengalensis]|uniref:multiple epidermal growth factor-like domains protein 6 isoform X2 n=1 Tax=Prionailurus bengalensis TaxID=37029 RepID=UPI001CAA1A27|nr:multiple epidermal growth factor-like domains protein 6 isoform X2 [Prionailurus bengalensis]